MSDTVVRVENLSNKYIIRHQQAQQYTALRDVIADGGKYVIRAGFYECRIHSYEFPSANAITGIKEGGYEFYR